MFIKCVCFLLTRNETFGCWLNYRVLSHPSLRLLQHGGQASCSSSATEENEHFLCPLRAMAVVCFRRASQVRIYLFAIKAVSFFRVECFLSVFHLSDLGNPTPRFKVQRLALGWQRPFLLTFMKQRCPFVILSFNSKWRTVLKAKLVVCLTGIALVIIYPTLVENESTGLKRKRAELPLEGCQGGSFSCGCRERIPYWDYSGKKLYL